ncbi:MAG: HAD hydrolase-like protein, partial [Thermodesulfobacteriota bacterium]|nr:HAD hydrolase-like protein [Thermodesulfobacteriota bacterium]
MIKLVIFDCDGVMFDSLEANIQFYNRILAHFGKPKMTREEIDYVHCHTAEDSVNYIFRNDHRIK